MLKDRENQEENLQGESLLPIMYLLKGKWKEDQLPLEPLITAGKASPQQELLLQERLIIITGM